MPTITRLILESYYNSAEENRFRHL